MYCYIRGFLQKTTCYPKNNMNNFKVNRLGCNGWTKFKSKLMLKLTKYTKLLNYPNSLKILSYETIDLQIFKSYHESKCSFTILLLQTILSVCTVHTLYSFKILPILYL